MISVSATMSFAANSAKAHATIEKKKPFNKEKNEKVYYWWSSCVVSTYIYGQCPDDSTILLGILLTYYNCDTGEVTGNGFIASERLCPT